MSSISRRRFLEYVAAASAVAVIPPLFGDQVTAAAKDKLQPTPAPRLVGPNDRIQLACVGIGNRGGEIIGELYKTGLVEVVALCDTDMGAPQTEKILRQFPTARRFKDFRVMFDKMAPQIDAVSVGTPDHSHFPITIMAMSLGKHVYVEKPLARTFLECELLIKAERKYGVVTQMGNQGHSEANYFQFKAWKDAGIIKDVTAITAHMNSARRWHGWDTSIRDYPAEEFIPGTLDWDTWLAAVPHRKFNKEYVNGQWRSWYDFGLGALGDWGAHIIDTAHEFLELGLPYEIDPVLLRGHNRFFFPQSSTVAFKFPKRGEMPPVTITWYDGTDNLPEVPEGYGVSELDPNIPPSPAGTITPAKLNPGKIIYSKDLIFKGGSHGSTLSIIPEAKAKAMASKLPEVPKSTSNHFRNFLLSCRKEESVRSPFSVSAPLSQVFALGVIAQRTGEKVLFDREKGVIINSKIANELLAGAPPREEWKEFYK